MARDVVCIHGWFRNTEILSSIHGGAWRADKEPSRRSEAITGFKLPTYFYKAEQCRRDVGHGAAAHPTSPGRAAGWPRRGQSRHPSCLSHSVNPPPARCSSMVLSSPERFFSFKPFSLTIFALTMLIASSGRQCVAPSHSALGPLVFLSA